MVEDVFDAIHLNASHRFKHSVEVFCLLVLAATLSFSIFLQEVKAGGLLWSAFSFVNQ